jgi:exopolysaccharide biosynthesis polyprenyl glycosylphosphotransferase
MADLSHGRPDTLSSDRNTSYARMIPGTPASRLADPGADLRTHVTTNNKELRAIKGRSELRESSQPRWMQWLMPQIQATDRTILFQLTLLDLLVLLAACLLSWVASPVWSLRPAMMPVYGVLLILFAFSEGLYNEVGAASAEELPILMRSAVFAMALILMAEWNEMQFVAALTAVGTSLAGLMLWRQVRRRGWNEYFRETAPRNVLIVGAGPMARTIARALKEDPLHSSMVVGFLDDHVPLSPQVLGRISDLDWLARSQFIDEVILAVPNDPRLVRQAAEVAFRNCLDIRAVPDLPPGLWPKANVDRIGGIPIIALHHESLPRAALLLKRLLDVAGALFGLVLLAPVMGLLALWIRLDSPGPIFYSAERTGAKGRPFRCHKFRSMSTGADRLKDALRERNQREGPIFKIVDDPRITRFGHFLRRFSLDELPQLWNVLCGEMSLVGPRPHPVDEVNRYQLHHYRRLDMKPGMTGLWQIRARQSASFDLNMHLDLTYIENWNLRLDLHILMSTIRVVFSPEGA